MDDLGVLDLVAQDPNIPDNNGPEQMQKVIAQAPIDLTEINEVVVDLSLAQDKSEQGMNVVAEALQLRKVGKISVSQVMALEDIITGVVDETNPIGLYTETPTAANLDETVKRVNQRGMDLVEDARQSTRSLIEKLVKLLNVAGAGTLETVDTYHQQYIRAVSAYTDVHGFLPMDFQRRGAGIPSQAMMSDYISRHLDEVNCELDDAIAKYVKRLKDEHLITSTSAALIDMITGSYSISVDGKSYELTTLARGEKPQYVVETKDIGSEFPEMLRLSNVVTGVGSKTTIEYLRSLAGAMLGLATYLNDSLKQEEQDANALRETSFDAVAVAALGQALQRRFNQGIALLHATAGLYSELALTENKAASLVPDASQDSPSLENLRAVLGIK